MSGLRALLYNLESDLYDPAAAYLRCTIYTTRAEHITRPCLSVTYATSSPPPTRILILVSARDFTYPESTAAYTLDCRS